MDEDDGVTSLEKISALREQLSVTGSQQAETR
jgi:hypothetical protein